MDSDRYTAGALTCCRGAIARVGSGLPMYAGSSEFDDLLRPVLPTALPELKASGDLAGWRLGRENSAEGDAVFDGLCGALAHI